MLLPGHGLSIHDLSVTFTAAPWHVPCSVKSGGTVHLRLNVVNTHPLPHEALHIEMSKISHSLQIPGTEIKQNDSKNNEGNI